MRRRSARSTRNSKPSMLAVSPRRGSRPNSFMSRPATVSKPSASESRAPKYSLNSAMRVTPRTVNWRSASRRMFWSSSTSNSSSISPTICSMTSSMVHSPDTPPYSSTTIAMWLRLRRNSLSSTFSRLDSGTNTAGRMYSRMSKRSRACAVVRRSRSFASRMPTMSSRSSSITGKREWPDSTTTGRMRAASLSRRTNTICARGTMMSRTCRSPTSSTPSSMVSASLSTSPRSPASRSTASSCLRSCGSGASPCVRRFSQRPVVLRSFVIC